MRKRLRAGIRISFLLFCLKISLAASVIDIYDAQQIGVKYGDAAKKRFGALKKLILENKDLPERERLVCVNNFFNQVPYESDRTCWGKSDYWATPVEMLGVGKADCEDYAIAKFFTLLEMGVPREKLFLTYALTDNATNRHMVLAYYADEFSTPLILDNRALSIEPEAVSKKYIPLYRFNLERFVAFDHGFEHKSPIDFKKLENWESIAKRLSLI